LGVSKLGGFYFLPREKLFALAFEAEALMPKPLTENEN
jgi:hypothetical protein